MAKFDGGIDELLVLYWDEWRERDVYRTVRAVRRGYCMVSVLRLVSKSWLVQALRLSQSYQSSFTLSCHSEHYLLHCRVHAVPIPSRISQRFPGIVFCFRRPHPDKAIHGAVSTKNLTSVRWAPLNVNKIRSPFQRIS